jgi:hypothetical protein
MSSKGKSKKEEKVDLTLDPAEDSENAEKSEKKDKKKKKEKKEKKGKKEKKKDDSSDVEDVYVPRDNNDALKSLNADQNAVRSLNLRLSKHLKLIYYN